MLEPAPKRHEVEFLEHPGSRAGVFRISGEVVVRRRIGLGQPSGIMDWGDERAEAQVAAHRRRLARVHGIDDPPQADPVAGRGHQHDQPYPVGAGQGQRCRQLAPHRVSHDDQRPLSPPVDETGKPFGLRGQ